MSTWFSGIFKVISITNKGYIIIICQFPERENTIEVIDPDYWRTIDIIIYGRSVERGQNYIIYRSARLP